MSQYLEGQTHQLAEALQEHGFTAANVTALGQNSNGVLDQIKLILLGLATVIQACLKLALDKVFNPSEFIGSDWKIWKGPADGDGLEGDKDCVPEPDVVDFEQIVMETHLQGKETSVHGEEKMRRARASQNKQLAGKAFLALWNNWLACKNAGKPEDSILERLRKSGKIGNVIYFFGLALRSPVGSRLVLCLYFYGEGWNWSCHWLDGHWGAGSPSVALASVKAQS